MRIPLKKALICPSPYKGKGETKKILSKPGSIQCIILKTDFNTCIFKEICASGSDLKIIPFPSDNSFKYRSSKLFLKQESCVSTCTKFIIRSPFVCLLKKVMACSERNTVNLLLESQSIFQHHEEGRLILLHSDVLTLI